MSKKNIILLVVVVGAVLGFMYYKNSSAPVENTMVTPSPVESIAPVESSAPEVMIKEHKIEFKADAFSPKELTIKKGEKVTFVNNGDRKIWPASAMHPDHNKYPGSGIAKCKTAEATMIFDACAGVEMGSSWSFTFNEVGTWGYHDHLRSSVFGKIIVTE